MEPMTPEKRATKAKTVTMLLKPTIIRYCFLALKTLNISLNI
jgi:hypothetical protein